MLKSQIIINRFELRCVSQQCKMLFKWEAGRAGGLLGRTGGKRDLAIIYHVFLIWKECFPRRFSSRSGKAGFRLA